jgi:Mg-chelatase subunit ChlD
VALLVGLVSSVAVGLLLFGTAALGGLQDQARAETGEVAVQELDSRIGSLAASRGDAETVVDLGGKSPDEVSLSNSGSMTIATNGGQCSATLPLSTVRYQSDGGDTVAYQAGGVWRQSGDQSVVVSPPSVTYQNDTLSASLVNLTGTIGDDRFRLQKDGNASENATSDVRSTLFAGDCRRPSDVSLSVTSDFYRAWEGYLDDETPATPTVDDATQTVEIVLDQSDLPERIDDDRNDVVNLSDPDLVDPDPVGNTIPGNGLSIDKSAGNEYFVSAEPIGGDNGTVVSDIRRIDGGEIYRPPIDVVFVLDESGSMDDDPNGDGTDKAQVAKQAARSFVGQLNASDRAGVVAFTTESKLYPTDNGEYLTNDFGPNGVNSSIDNVGKSGGTGIGWGIARGQVLLETKSNRSRERVMIVLSDGKNNVDPEYNDVEGIDDNDGPIDAAEDASQSDITIHTVGFGNPDNDTLEAAAETTGGTYTFTNEDGLEDVFDKLFAQITETRQIVREPVALNTSVDGASFEPQIPGNTSGLASGSLGPNVNDPTAPAEFSYAVSTGDGSILNVSAVEYGCESWELTSITQTNYSAPDNETYNEVRCAELDTSNRTEIAPTNVSVFLDGADMSSYATGDEAFWQPTLLETLAPYLDATDHLELASNEAVVIYDFPDGQNGEDYIALRYEFGLPDSTRADTIVDVDLTEASIENR